MVTTLNKEGLLKYIISFGFMMMLTAFSSQAQASCSSTLDQSTEASLKKFLKDLNPFWGTWRGTYQGESIVGELYLDKQNRFNVKGRYKTTELNDFKVRLCYRNNKFQAIVYGMTVNIDVISSRKLQATHFLLNGPVAVQR